MEDPSLRNRQNTQCSVWKIGRWWCRMTSILPWAPSSFSVISVICLAFKSCVGVIRAREG